MKPTVYDPCPGPAPCVASRAEGDTFAIADSPIVARVLITSGLRGPVSRSTCTEV